MQRFPVLVRPFASTSKFRTEEAKIYSQILSKLETDAAAKQEISVPIPSVQKLENHPPDQDLLLHQFARFIMQDGKLETAQKHLRVMLASIRTITNKDALPIVREAVSTACPTFRNVSQSITATKRVFLPLPLTERQRVRKSLSWIVDASAKRRNEKEFGKRIALEMLAVLDGSSQALQKRDEVHRQATLARSNVGKVTTAKGKQARILQNVVF